MTKFEFKLERFQHNWPGYRTIMTSSEVSSMLERKGSRIKSAIAPEIGIDDWDVVVSPRTGRTRARVMVSGVPLSIEQRRGLLGAAIDAAKGG